MKTKKISIKPSPVVIIKKLIVIEVLLAIIVVMISIFVDVLALYGRFPFAEILSGTAFIVILLVLLQLVFLVTTFLSWYFDNYEVTSKRVIHRRGIVFKKKQMQPSENITSITQTQGLLGRWLNYASIELNGPTGVLAVIPDVYKAQDEIEKIEEVLKIDPTLVPQIQNEEIEQMIANGEGKNLEFKSSFRWDNKKGAVNKDLEQIILKTVTAFMNTEGGRLLIGVNDEGEIVGIDEDLRSVKKKNHDGFENHFTTTFSSFAGPQYTQYYSVDFEECKGKEVCIVNVLKASLPVYFKDNGSEKFYVRAGNSTRELNVSEAFKYIKTNFPEYSG